MSTAALGEPPAATTPYAADTSAKGRKVLAAEIAEPFRAEIRTTITERYGDRPPKLVGLLGNDDFGARKYAEWTGKACAADGIDYELREVPMHELEQALNAANEDPQVSGIMIYYPVFGATPSFYGTSMDDYLRDTIAPEKDVEGLCYTYRNKLYRNQRFLDAQEQNKCVLPCTPLSCVKILEHLGEYDEKQPVGERLAGRTITVINRSEIVGRPLAAMLANDGADVYSCDIDSIYLMKRGQLIECPGETSESCVRKSEIVITGVPVKAFRLPSEWIQPNTTVINVASFKNVDEASLLEIPGVQYVPLVGKVTVAMLERNVLRLHENYHAKAVLRDDLKQAAAASAAAIASAGEPAVGAREVSPPAAGKIEESPAASPAKDPAATAAVEAGA